MNYRILCLLLALGIATGVRAESVSADFSGSTADAAFVYDGSVTTAANLNAGTTGGTWNAISTTSTLGNNSTVDVLSDGTMTGNHLILGILPGTNDAGHLSTATLNFDSSVPLAGTDLSFDAKMLARGGYPGVLFVDLFDGDTQILRIGLGSSAGEGRGTVNYYSTTAGINVDRTPLTAEDLIWETNSPPAEDTVTLYLSAGSFKVGTSDADLVLSEDLDYFAGVTSTTFDKVVFSAAESKATWGVDSITVPPPDDDIATNPNPTDGESGVALDTNLKWSVPTGAVPDRFVLNIRPTDDNWLDTANTTVVDPVVDLDDDGDPDTIEAVVPISLNSASHYYWRVDAYYGTESVPSDTWDFTTLLLPGDVLKLTEWKLESAYDSGGVWITADTSGEGNNGTFINPPVGGPFFAGGIDGNCLELTGEDDSVVKEEATFLPLDETDPWSMNLYLYLNGEPNDWTRIANFGDTSERQLLIYRNSEIAFIYQNKYLLLSGAALAPDRWYMLTVTYDGSCLTMFVDGVEVVSKQLPFTGGDELDPNLNLLHYAQAGNFHGRIDEFTIWSDTLPATTMDQLVDQLAIVGDSDGDGSIVLSDFMDLASNWLTDNSMMLADLLLDDFSSYTADTDPDFIAAWEPSVEGDNQLSLEASQEALIWTYDLKTGRDAGLYHWSGTGVDLSQYDELHIRIHKNAGSTGGSLYCKFIELDADGTLWDAGQVNCPGGIAAVPETEWFEWVIDLNLLVTWDAGGCEVPYDRIKGLDGLHIGTYGETGGSGSIIIDDIKLVRTSPRCDASGFIIGDLNGNCRVDIVDLGLFAGHWLN